MKKNIKWIVIIISFFLLLGIIFFAFLFLTTIGSRDLAHGFMEAARENNVEEARGMFHESLLEEGPFIEF